MNSWNAAPTDPAVCEADHGDPSRSGSRSEDGNAGPGRKEAGSRKRDRTVPGALEYGRFDDFLVYCVRYPYISRALEIPTIPGWVKGRRTKTGE